LVRESLGREDWAPRSVWFAHPAPPDTSELLAYFRTSAVEFARGSNRIACSARELELPFASGDQALLAVLDEQAQAVVASKPAPGDPFYNRLREQIRIALRQGPPKLEDVAAALHMSPRTLQRRLRERDMSFQAVVDEVRHRLALMYLDRSELSVGEIAFLLGYSELRAFARAFRRWTGTSPSELRECKR